MFVFGLPKLFCNGSSSKYMRCPGKKRRSRCVLCRFDVVFYILSGIARILILKSTHVMCRSMSKSKEGCLDKMSF